MPLSYALEDDVHNGIEALKCYDKIIEINPNHVKAWIKKGLIHEKELGSYADAIKCYDKAIEINSNYADNSAAVAWSCVIDFGRFLPGIV